MARQVCVGLVSTSWWAEEMYLPSLQSHSQALVAAICGRNQERAGQIAARYGINGVYADYRQMIEQAGLDALIVALPDDLHYEVTMAALDARLPVLCEKPLALNAQQAGEMAQKANEAGVKHMVLYTLRWIPQFQYVRDLVAQGFLGRLYHCEFRYLFGYGRQQEYIWRLDRRRATGVLGDIGSHLIDLAHWLVGDIEAVSAQLGAFVERPAPAGEAPAPANDYAVLLAQFSGGAQGVIQASAVAHLGDRALTLQGRLYGEGGSLEFDVPPFGPANEAIIRGAASGEQRFAVLEMPHAYWGDADPAAPLSVFTKNSAGPRGFIDALLGSEGAIPTFDDGYKVQQVIDAALAAQAAGCAVRVGR